MKKQFSLKLNGSQLMNLEIEGDDDLVKSFIEQSLVGSFGAFYESRKAFTDCIVNGVKLKMYSGFRDEKGHFVSQEKMGQIMGIKPLPTPISK